MNETPQTPAEWQAYIDTLTGADLLSKALAANCVTFVRVLEDDGLTADEIESVLTMFAKRLEADGQHVPSGGTYIDYNSLLAPIPVPIPA